MSALINDVSDTALWVAAYRARETQRPDALFKDPFAEKLASERGKRIASEISQSRYVDWSVVLRTIMIDNFIKKLMNEGIEAVINLGAGLDTRPYRLDFLPERFTWIEVDYPHLITYKEDRLINEKPRCKLERISLDLANLELRRKLFDDVSIRSKNILVLTEGVTPYLTEEQVGSLADDLKARPEFRYWITDYFSPEIKKHIQRGKRKMQMTNAPFVFFPRDWKDFYFKHGWTIREINYTVQEALRVNRPIPAPWLLRFFMLFMSEAQKKKSNELSGYAIMRPR